jgi:hypothetical protein
LQIGFTDHFENTLAFGLCRTSRLILSSTLNRSPSSHLGFQPHSIGDERNISVALIDSNTVNAI